MPAFAADAVDLVRGARWITRERLARWGLILAIAMAAFLAWDTAAHTTLGMTDAAGEHAGRDFINFWAASRAALAGHAAKVFDVAWFHAFQQSLAGPASEIKIYGYPPPAMLATLPLGLLPFLPALGLWTLLGAALVALLLARLTGWRPAALAVVASPAGALNMLSGQTGFFTAALLGGGLLLLETRPILAGLLLGLLSFKPQLALLVPVALLAGGHWRAIGAAAATVLALVAASLWLFGAETWVAFFRQLGLLGQMMQLGASFWPRMPTVFAALRLLGAGIGIAQAAQLVSTLAAAAAVAFVWHRPLALDLKAAVLAISVFLASPYAWDYDMPVLLLAAAWLARAAGRGGLLPWERFAVLAIVVLPWPMILLARILALPVGPVVLWLSLFVLLRRARQSAA
jgi:alpha-1,2-mannosyltransferase